MTEKTITTGPPIYPEEMKERIWPQIGVKTTDSWQISSVWTLVPTTLGYGEPKVSKFDKEVAKIRKKTCEICWVSNFLLITLKKRGFTFKGHLNFLIFMQTQRINRLSDARSNTWKPDWIKFSDSPSVDAPQLILHVFLRRGFKRFEGVNLIKTFLGGKKKNWFFSPRNKKPDNHSGLAERWGILGSEVFAEKIRVTQWIFLTSERPDKSVFRILKAAPFPLWVWGPTGVLLCFITSI